MKVRDFLLTLCNENRHCAYTLPLAFTKINNQMNNLLYYPYINLTKNDWFSKSILYWDEIFTIVPDSFSWEPERLQPFTRKLIKNELIIQAFPDNYDIDFEKFEDKMLQIINSEEFDIDTKRTNFENGNFDYIHKDKFAYNLMSKLASKEYKLAKKDEGSSWYYVEQETSRILMWLLATVIGIKGNMNPSTDQNYYFTSGFYENFTGYKEQQVRDIFIEELLPFPINPDFEKLKKFKEKNRDKLNKFRNRVEEIINIAVSIENSETRIKKSTEMALKMSEEKEELIAKLEESKIGKVIKSLIAGVVITGAAAWYSEKLTPLIGETVGAVYTGTKTYLENPIKGMSLEYIALLDKKIRNNKMAKS